MSTDAYAAGLIDGEGCIYVVKETRSYYAVVEVGMTAKASSVLSWMKANYGGKIYVGRAATEKWDEARVWHLHGDNAAVVLRALMPHLILKREQARLAISVQDIRTSLVPQDGQRARWTEEALERCATIHATIHEANRKGPSQIPSPPIDGMTLVAQRVGGQWVTTQGDLLSDTGWAPWSGPWPTSGLVWRGAFWTLNSSESRSDAVECLLSDVLETTGEHLARYSLSAKACRAILHRSEQNAQRLPALLREALEAVAQTGAEGNSDS